MAVREYIGPRIVPRFADPIDWDKTKKYESLTVVSYKGSSYTSKMAVPTGIDISDIRYWALTANYNAQIEEYRRQSEGAATAAAKASSDVTAGITQMQQNVDKTTHDITTQMGTLKSQVSADLAKAVADSRSAATSVTAQLQSRFPLKTADIADKAITQDKLGMGLRDIKTIDTMSVRTFGNATSDVIGYDNTGAHYPDGVTVQGSYIEDLGLLIVNHLETIGSTQLNVLLPSYVPTPVADVRIGNLIGSTHQADFANWRWVVFTNDRHLGVINPLNANIDYTLMGNIVFCLRNFVSGNVVPATIKAGGYDA